MSGERTMRVGEMKAELAVLEIAAEDLMKRKTQCSLDEVSDLVDRLARVQGSINVWINVISGKVTKIE